MKYSSIILCSFFLVCALSSSAKTVTTYRDSDGVLRARVTPDWPKEIVAEGEGESKMKAIDDACDRAVMMATGWEVEGSIKTGNDKRLENQRTKKYKAKIDSYEVLNVEEDEKRGLIYVKIKAKVSKLVTKKEPTVNTMPCPDCNSTRFIRFEAPCPQCGGSGTTKVVVRKAIQGYVQVGGGRCPTCNGAGKKEKSKYCNRCRGKGKIALPPK